MIQTPFQLLCAPDQGQRTGGSLPEQPSEVPHEQGRMPCECYLQGILSRLPNFSGYLSGKLFCYITIQ